MQTAALTSDGAPAGVSPPWRSAEASLLLSSSLPQGRKLGAQVFKLHPRSLFGVLALIGLASMKPVVECIGCQAAPNGTSTAGPQGGWNLTISIGVSSGVCTALDGDCVAEACSSTVLVTGYGPPSTSLGACYQTTGAPKYCISPTPMTDASGNVSVPISKRTGCGNDTTYEVSGPNGESKVTAAMKCSACQ